MSDETDVENFQIVHVMPRHVIPCSSVTIASAQVRESCTLIVEKSEADILDILGLKVIRMISIVNGVGRSKGK